MILKLLETFFRHKLLILLPAILVPLIVVPIARQVTPIFYESTAGIWVGRAAHLRYEDDSINRYLSPAQNQSNRLADLLRSRTFQLDIIRRTSLAARIKTPEDEVRVRQRLQRDLYVQAAGNNWVVLGYRGETPEVALQVVNAFIDVHRERATTEGANQAELAISFYTTRLEEAEAALAQSNAEVRRYVAANPRLTDPVRSTTVAGVSAAVIDPKFSELRNRAEADEREVDRVRQYLEQARLESAAAMEGREIGWQVVDPPQLPTQPIRAGRTLVVLGAAAATGIALSTVLLVVLVMMDRAVRTEADLVGTRLVGMVKDLRVKRAPKGFRTDATRRAIGFVAGTALPAPPRAG